MCAGMKKARVIWYLIGALNDVICHPAKTPPRPDWRERRMKHLNVDKGIENTLTVKDLLLSGSVFYFSWQNIMAEGTTVIGTS